MKWGAVANKILGNYIGNYWKLGNYTLALLLEQ